MFTKFLKRFSTKTISGIPQAFKAPVTTPPQKSFHMVPIRPSYTPEEELQIQLLAYQKESSINLPYIRNHFTKLYSYLSVSTFVGISSAFALSLIIPDSAASAGLLVAALGLDYVGAEQVAKMRPKTTIETTSTGNIQYKIKNPIERKLAYAALCAAQSCVIAFTVKLGAFVPPFLPVALIGCLSSILGQIIYSKFLIKTRFSSSSLFTCGMLSGSLGLGLISSGILAPLGIFFPTGIEHIESISYLGMFLYNLYSMHDSKRVFQDIVNGKEDHLKHATELSDGWSCMFLPYAAAFLLERFF